MPTDSVALERPVASPRASAAEPYRELSVDAISRGRNPMVIWQDLVVEHGFTGGYSSVASSCDFASAWVARRIR